MAIQTNSLNSELLNAAILGLEAQKRKIEEQLDQVRSLLGIRADGQKRRGRPPKNAADATGSDVSLVAGAPENAGVSALKRAPRWLPRNRSAGQLPRDKAAPQRKRLLRNGS